MVIEMKAVVFDMDGLMFDSERIVQLSWQKAGLLMINRDLGKEIYHTLGFNRQKRRDYFYQLLGEKFDFETFQVLSSFYYYQYVKNNGLLIKKGLKELLLYLKENQYKIAIATSSSYKTTMNHLKNAHIEDYFDAIITSDFVTKAKPDPQIYILACQKLGVKPQEAYALEDSYHGIKAAYYAHMKAIFVPDLLKDDTVIKDYIETKCDSLLEVIEYIRRNEKNENK